MVLGRFVTHKNTPGNLDGRSAATNMVIGWVLAHNNMDLDSRQQSWNSNGLDPLQQCNMHGHQPRTAWNLGQHTYDLDTVGID